jgi:hypothetical protein
MITPPPTPKPAPAADIAIGKSISFRPGSLYSDAEAYGRAQKTRIGQPLNPSQVVCLALERFFEAEGFARPSQGGLPPPELGELLALAEELGLDSALAALRGTLRSRAAAQKPAA